MEKNSTQVRNVVFGLALVILTLTVASMFTNVVELSLYRPVDVSNKTTQEGWDEFQSSLVAGLVVLGTFASLGVVFSVLTLKIKKLRLAGMIVAAALTLAFFIVSISLPAQAFYYITDEMNTVVTPIYIGNSSRYSSAVTLSSAIVAETVQECVCFGAIAVCSLFGFIEGRKANKLPPVDNEEVKSSAAPEFNPVATDGDENTQAPAHHYCRQCGACLSDNAKFCTSCGEKVE